MIDHSVGSEKECSHPSDYCLEIQVFLCFICVPVYSLLTKSRESTHCSFPPDTMLRSPYILARNSVRHTRIHSPGLSHAFPIFRSQKRAFSIEPTLIVNALTDSLEAAHTYTGLPWWALIPITTVTLRSAWTLPLAILQRLRIQKQNSLRPIIAATGPVLRLNLAKKALKAANSTDTSVAALASPLRNIKYEEIMVLSTKETRRRQKKLFKTNGVQLYKNIFLPAAQIPLWVCMSFTFRNLSGWLTWDSLLNKPLDPTLYNEGLLWFQDLTCADPFHIFPLAIGVVALVNVEWTFRTFALMKTTRRKMFRPTLTDSMANVSRMAVVFLMAISLHAPTALTIYWLSSQVFSLLQNVFLDLAMPISFTPNSRLEVKTLTSKTAVNVVNDKQTNSE